MPADWKQLVTEQQGRAAKSDPIIAQTYLRHWGTASTPVQYRCDDGLEYVVKGPHKAREIVNEQVAAILGRKIGAPIPDVTQASVSDAVVAALPPAIRGQVKAGISHALAVVPDVTDVMKDRPHYESVVANHDRFAALAVLFGWLLPSDRQFIYGKHDNLVHSFDHGHFFGRNWTPDTLSQAPPAQIDQWFKNGGVPLNGKHIQDALSRLKAVTDIDIAEAVTTPPDDWGLTIEERTALAEWLAQRGGQLLASAS